MSRRKVTRPKKRAVRRRKRAPRLAAQVRELQAVLLGLKEAVEVLDARLTALLRPVANVKLDEVVRLGKLIEAEIKDRGPWSEHIAAAALRLAAGAVGKQMKGSGR